MSKAMDGFKIVELWAHIVFTLYPITVCPLAYNKVRGLKQLHQEAKNRSTKAIAAS